MKSIQIKGNSNIKKILPDQYNSTRKEYSSWDLSSNLLLPSKQPELVNMLYLNSAFPEKKLLENAIKKKLSSYKQQDIKNEIYSEKFFITFENTISTLVESKMKCFYCNNEMLLLYKEIKNGKQWTLDRKNNDMGHNNDNVVISCLDCNLKRRNTNMKKFLFTKKLSLTKLS